MYEVTVVHGAGKGKVMWSVDCGSTALLMLLVGCVGDVL